MKTKQVPTAKEFNCASGGTIVGKRHDVEYPVGSLLTDIGRAGWLCVDGALPLSCLYESKLFPASPGQLSCVCENDCVSAGAEQKRLAVVSWFEACFIANDRRES